jgi:hypothetical protein
MFKTLEDVSEHMEISKSHWWKVGVHGVILLLKIMEHEPTD